MKIHKLVMVIFSYIKFCQSRKKGSVDVGSQRRVLGEKLQSYAWLCCLLQGFINLYKGKPRKVQFPTVRISQKQGGYLRIFWVPFTS